MTPNKVMFTPQMHQFLKANHSHMTNKELAEALGLRLTRVRQELYSLGLKRMELQYWTDEQIQFLKDNYKMLGDTEIAELFTDRWSKDKGWSKKHIEKKRRYLNLKRTDAEKQAIWQRNKDLGRWSQCATKMWETKGTANPEGTIVVWRLRDKPIQLIKIGKKYIHLSVYVWEQHYGPVPKGMNIMRIDGNTLNNTIYNLKMVSDGELAVINSKRRAEYPEEVKELEKLIRKLNKKIKEYGTK